MSNSETSFKPDAVHDYFIEITKRPHPSANQGGVVGNEDPVREYVAAVAEQLHVEVVFYEKEATKPGERVIVLRRPGSGQFADSPPIILQAHMDMVYNPVNMAFPLDAVLAADHTDGKWIKARDKQGKDCTLGADDGMGVATALAVLGDYDLRMYPIECLFTVQEETNMGGAQECDVKNLTGDKLLNLDAETLTQIIYGSAGGNETCWEGAVQRSVCPDGYTARKISITGLKGGHSGIDINKGRVNALKALGQTLVRLNSRMTHIDGNSGIGSYEFLVYDLKRNDVIKANAIPAEAEAVIALPQAQAEQFDKDFKAYCETLKAQNQPVEPGFTYAVEEAVSSAEPLDENSVNLLLCMLQQIPTGVINMIPGNPGIVQASCNVYNVALTEGKLTMDVSNRSSSGEVLNAVNDLQVNIGKAFDFTVETGINSYPSWEPVKTKILDVAEKVYKELYGTYEATVIHAGLECGVLADRFKAELGRDLEAVSIGPNIEDPHTPRESLQIQAASGKETVQQFYDAVSMIIKEAFS